MKKIKLKTNKGKVFDWFLNIYINAGLWLSGVEDNEKAALEFTARQLKIISKFIR